MSRVQADLRAAREALVQSGTSKRALARKMGLSAPQVVTTLRERAYCSERQARRFREAAEALAVEDDE